MPKYINADDIKNDIKTLWDWETVDGIKSSTVLKQVLSDIDNINEAVVHCKDCKYGKVRRNYNGILPWCDKYCVAHREFMQSNDYCSYGERRKTQ